MTNAAVLRHWRLTPLAVEMRIRRLRRAQRWAAEPTRHSQELAAAFGTMRAETDKGIARLGPAGEIGPSSTHWAHQFAGDVASLAQVEVGRDLLVQLSNRSPVCVFYRPAVDREL